MKVKFPLHFESAVKEAINNFAKDGFIYSINSPTVKTDTHLIMDIDANEQEVGVKIGVLLSMQVIK